MSELTPPPIRFNVAAATLRREFYLLLCGAYDNEWDVMPLALNYSATVEDAHGARPFRASLILLAVFSAVALAEAASVIFGSEGFAIAVVQLLAPALNLFIGVVALASLPIAWLYAPKTITWLYVVLAIASPVVATGFVLVVGAVAGVKLIVC
jgi:hypothetical protein